MSFLIFLAIIVALIAWGIGIYNSLVNLRNRVKNAFAQIDVQLTRRHDLIPNLVEAVKGYMKHERDTLEAVVNARNAAVSDLSAAKADPASPKVRLAPRSVDCSPFPRRTRISRRTRT